MSRDYMIDYLQISVHFSNYRNGLLTRPYYM